MKARRDKRKKRAGRSYEDLVDMWNEIFFLLCIYWSGEENYCAVE